ncbi:MAG: molybdopterin oxidoreductase family protein [Alphaproteobacteria bacterium]|nr:molybdopterin oxidoreductase family protein [Alphaproteobacteria bacterium]
MAIEQKVRGACPLDCPDTCSWTVTVRDGVAVKLEGDRDHPYTRGALCVKMKDYLDYTRTPNRLLHPLRRVGPKGAGRFERVSWEAALVEIAARLKETIAQFGGEAIWPYHGTGNMGLIQGSGGAGRRLWNALGASHHGTTICAYAGNIGTGYTLGHDRVGMDPETLDRAKLILLWSANVLSTHHHLWRVIDRARRQGAHVVAIDPVRTRTAAAVDEHLAPLPGTDAALALGLLHVVVAEGAEDRDFIARHTLGWEAFRARIQEFPPERVAAITGLTVAQIVSLGRRLAHTRPTGIRLSQGIQRHAGGGMAIRTISCIPGVTGDWRYPGGGAGYDTRYFFQFDWDGLWGERLGRPGRRTLSMVRLGENLLEARDPPVKALFVNGSNPVASVPDQNAVRRGLARDDLFTVVVDHVPTDTTAYADIVLPATMAVEHADLIYSYGHVYLNWNAPAVAPPAECLPISEVFRRLAQQLGLNHPDLYASDQELAATALDTAEMRRQGLTLSRLQRDGWVRLDVPAAPLADGFPSPSGKLEFWSERMAAAGHDPLAGYTPPGETADAALGQRYPLALIAGASHNFLNSVFGGDAIQRRREGELRVVLNPADAARRGLADGTPVRIFNDRGEFRALAEVSDSVRPGVVGSVKGFWPMHRPDGANANATTSGRPSDFGGAVFHDNRVEVAALA